MPHPTLATLDPEVRRQAKAYTMEIPFSTLYAELAESEAFQVNLDAQVDGRQSARQVVAEGTGI